MPAAEAEVVADAVFRDAFQGVVERVDAQLGPLAVALGAPANQGVVHVGQDGVVHLQQQAGFVDRLVFLAQGVGDGEDVFALGRIVFVDAVIGGGRRGHRGHEGLFHLHRRQGLGEGFDGKADALSVGIGDRADTGFGGGAFDGAGEVLCQEFLEANPVGAQPLGLAQLVRADLETGDALDDVVGPAFLAVFTVVDDVEADRGLLLHHLCHRSLHRHGVGDGILRRTLLEVRQRQEFGRSRDAAHVGGEDAVYAALHRTIPFLSVSAARVGGPANGPAFSSAPG